MKNNPLVSIVIPTFNQAKYLAESIKSILAQDYDNIECIVIDDGSTDSTPDILERFKSRVRCNRHENIGQAHTLNKGWSQCGGKYLGYLSSDDILFPSAIKELVSILESNSEIICAFPNSNLIDSTSKIIKRNICQPFDLEETLIRQECYIGPGALFRRSAFDALGGWDPSYKLAPDREFWIRMSALGHIEMCPSVLAGYRMHPQSESAKEHSEEVSREYLNFLDHFFNNSSVPPQILAKKNEAYGFAYLLMARNSFRGRRFNRGMQFYRRACEYHRELSGLAFKLRLLRNLISRPARQLLVAVRTIFND